MRWTILAGCVLALLLPARAAAAVSLQPIGTFSSPIYITSPPGDPRLFVVERGGTIQVLHDGMVSQFLDISARTTTDGERGLLSMAFDPNYAANGLFYVFYTGDGVDAGGALGDIHIDEFQVSGDPNVANTANRRTAWTFSHVAGNHNGGQLQFGKDGLLYITVGDNGTRSNAQSVMNPYGKVLRIDPHGAGEGDHGIPASNPFVGTAGASEEIWSLGLRNPFRFSFGHLTGDLMIGDVGEGTREEIDFSPAANGGGRGANYGWPCREGLIAGPTSCTGSFTAPVFDYPHADPGGDLAHGCAIIGGFVYQGNQVPELAGRYVYTDLCNGELRSIQLGLPLASGDRWDGPVVSGPNSLGEDGSCELYVTNGNVVDRIVSSQPPSTAPACATAPPASNAQATPAGPAPKSCRRHTEHRARAAGSAKKRKKLCVRGTWAPRL